MKLKHYLIIGVFALLSSPILAQNIDSRLLKSYQKQELTTLINTDKEKYDLLVYALGEGLQIVVVGKGKDMKYTGSISLPKGEYTFADLGLKITEMEQYFKIEGTDNVLMVKSFSLLNRLKNGK